MILEFDQGCEFQPGDRVETISHCIRTVVRVDFDEFAYDPKDLAHI